MCLLRIKRILAVQPPKVTLECRWEVTWRENPAAESSPHHFLTWHQKIFSFSKSTLSAPWFSAITIMSQNRSTCSLLDAAKAEGDLSNRILQGAFDVKDLQIQKVLNFEHLFCNKLEVLAKQYTSITVSILNHLTYDIYVSMDLFTYKDWDPIILQNALRLLQYTLDNLFSGGDERSGKVKGLGVTYKNCKNSSWKKKFNNTQKNAIKAFSSLLTHLRSGGDLPDNFFRVSANDKISTATFYKLMVRNEAQKLRGIQYDCTKVEVCKLSKLINRSVSSNVTLIQTLIQLKFSANFSHLILMLKKKCI